MRCTFLVGLESSHLERPVLAVVGVYPGDKTPFAALLSRNGGGHLPKGGPTPRILRCNEKRIKEKGYLVRLIWPICKIYQFY